MTVEAENQQNRHASLEPSNEKEPLEHGNNQPEDDLGLDLEPFNDVKDKFQDGVYSIFARMKTISSTGAILAIIFGLFLTFFGVRLLKPLATGSGFVVGFAASIKLLHSIPSNKVAFGANKDWIILGIAILAGALLSWLFWRLIKFALFGLGGACGYLLGKFVLTIVGNWVNIPGGELISIAFAITGGTLTLVFEKAVIYAVTSVAGSHLVFFGLDVFLKTGLVDKYRTFVHSGQVQKVNAKCWTMMAGMVVLSVTGIFVQFKLRKKRQTQSSEFK